MKKTKTIQKKKYKIDEYHLDDKELLETYFKFQIIKNLTKEEQKHEM